MISRMQPIYFVNELFVEIVFFYKNIKTFSTQLPLQNKRYMLKWKF